MMAGIANKVTNLRKLVKLLLRELIPANYKALSQEFKELIKSTKWSSPFNFLISRKCITILLTILILLFLRIPFENLICEVFIKGIFQKVNFTKEFDSLFLLISFIILIVVLKSSFRFYNPSFFQFYIIGIMLSLYAYYRYYCVKWEFITYNIDLLSDFAYLDFILIYTLYPGFLLIFFHFVPYKVLQTGTFLIEDLHIKKSSEDKLKRKEFAANIARRIVAQNFKRSFSIGILGSWGSGKTSFLKMIEEEVKMKTSNPIIIEFNAFYNHESTDIIGEFFTTLSNSVSGFSNDLSNKFQEYGKYLVNIVNNNGLKLISELIYLINNEKPKSIRDQYLKIDKELKKLGKQFLIFVDDVDRLRHQEIIELLKLIRNTADFSNTVYFVAFDKDYMIKSLRNYTEYQDENFIQKYFQYEFILPPFTKEILRQRFVELVSENIDENSANGVNHVINPGAAIVSTLFDVQMDTLRDVSRLANIFSMDYQNIKGEVDLTDFINLMILKTKYTSAYSLLSNNINTYLEQNIISGESKNCYKLKDVNDEVLIIKHLKDGKFKLPDEDLRNIESILKALFSQHDLWYHKENQLSIKNIYKIETYFNLRFMGGSISEVDFINGFRSNFDDFKKKLEEWIVNGQQSQVIERILREPINKRDALNNALNGLFFLGKNSEDGYIHNLVIDRIGNLMNFSKYIKEGIINSKKEIGEYIVENHLKTASPPYLFEKEFIYKLIKDKPLFQDNDYWDLDLNLLKNIQFDYFNNYIQNLSTLDWNVYRLYHKNYEIGNLEINEVIKEFIENKDYQQFLSDIINRDSFNETYSISDIVARIFGSYQEFGTFLKKLKTSNQLKEFSEFFEVSELYNFGQFFYFDFKTIKLRNFGNSVIDEFFGSMAYFEFIDHELFDYFKSEQKNISNKLVPFIIQLPIHERQVMIIRDNTELRTTDFLKGVMKTLLKVGQEYYKHGEITIQKEFKFKELGDGVLFKDEQAIIKLISIQPHLD